MTLTTVCLIKPELLICFLQRGAYKFMLMNLESGQQ